MAVRRNGRFYRRLHLTMIGVWTIMVPVALVTSLKTSLPFVVFISLYANWATEVSAWQAARAETRVDEKGAETETRTITE